MEICYNGFFFDRETVLEFKQQKTMLTCKLNKPHLRRLHRSVIYNW